MMDTKQFLEDQFGGHNELVSTLQAHGLPAPTPEAAYKWFRREAIPHDWWAIVVLAAERSAGHPISLEPYVEADDV